MPEYIQVVVNLPLTFGIFDYHVPPALQGKVLPGSLVTVPFGKQRVQAVVLGFVDVPQVPETRPVDSLLDAEPVLLKNQVELARWLANATLAPLAACIQLMLPPGLSQQADTLISLEASDAEPNGLTGMQREALALLKERGPLRGRQLDAAFPHRDWKTSLRPLVRAGVLSAQPVLPPPTVRPKVARTAQLARPLETALPALAETKRAGSEAVFTRRSAVLTYLAQEGGPVNVAWVYAASGAQLADLQRLAEMGLLILGETELWRDPLSLIEVENRAVPKLTPDQETAWGLLQPAVEAGQFCLLHGVTGSGKTELYLRAVEDTLQKGRQAIILVPEIGLTPQTVRRFMARFAGRVGLVHSHLSQGERYDTWRRARRGDLDVIIGARSALFTPLPRLGLIVVDECHDPSYAQSDTAPVYNAVKCAAAYARLAQAALILGSATPQVSQIYQAEHENWQIIKLPLRVLAHKETVQKQLARLGHARARLDEHQDVAALPLPAVTVVDMREELKQGNRSMFSRALQAGLQGVLERQEQAILFLNRRGSSTYVFCRECGHVINCPKCNLPLTAHEHDTRLRCHTCGYERQIPQRCPQCSSDTIKPYGAGTERVEAEVQKLFPQARVLRWDAETTSQKGTHEILMAHFVHHRADIIVGTQMLAKGLDLPLVTLVGAVLADVGLNLPDFRAGERGFQLLTQVAGRAGRSPLGGEVIFQTFQPEHYVLDYAARYDFAGFYQHELAARQQMGYPPYSRLTRLLIQGEDAARVQTIAQQLALSVKRWIETGNFSATEIIGPVPCFYARVNGQYRWQIVLRGPQPDAIIRQNLPLPDGCRVEVDPEDLL